MSETDDVHTETDSEDGGVPLSVIESLYEDGSDHDSAPTSVSQSSRPSSQLVPHAESKNSDVTSDSLNIYEQSSSTSIEAAGVAASSSSSSSSSDQSSADTALVFPTNNAATNPLASSQASSSVMAHYEPLLDDIQDLQSGTSCFLEDEAANSSNLQWDASVIGPPLSASTPLEQETLNFMLMDDPQEATSESLVDTTVYEDGQPLNGVAASSNDLYNLNFAVPLGWPNDALTTIPSISTDPEDDFVYSIYYSDIEDTIKNLSCDNFFDYWKRMYALQTPGYPRISDKANHLQKVQRPDRISMSDLQSGKQTDLQGINWSQFKTSKEEAREVRRMTYKNHTNHTPACPSHISNLGTFGTPEFKSRFSNDMLPNSDAFFQFKEIHTKFQGYISHFQLRHNIFASSKNALFYNKRPSNNYGFGQYEPSGMKPDAKIMCFNPATGTDECAIDFASITDKDSDTPILERPTTLTAGEGVLVVGSMEGIYALKPLSSTFPSPPTTGIICRSGMDASTNHIHNFPSRQSGVPQSAFSSNDMTIRILDCNTAKWVSTHHFPYQVNCSATSPDGRLRLLVGDSCSPIVCEAETGAQITKLPNHTNYGFACAWAPDGITMATGHQDGFVQIWDARKFSTSIASIPMQMAGCRTLQFSPLGAGRRVLVIAEPADFVHVVDGVSWESKQELELEIDGVGWKSKQEIEFFGEIAGIAMEPDGGRLYVSNQDERFGGLMEFERWDGGGGSSSQSSRRKGPGKGVRDSMKKRRPRYEPKSSMTDSSIWGRNLDWRPDDDLDEHPHASRSWAQRERQGLALENLVF